MNFVGKKRKKIERKVIFKGATAGASKGIGAGAPACCAQPDKDAAEPNGFLISGTMRRM